MINGWWLFAGLLAYHAAHPCWTEGCACRSFRDTADVADSFTQMFLAEAVHSIRVEEAA